MRRPTFQKLFFLAAFGALLLIPGGSQSSLANESSAEAKPAEHSAPPAEHGAPSKEGAKSGEAKSEGGEGESKPTPTPLPTDAPLKGRFDIKVLRPFAKTKGYRVEVTKISSLVGSQGDWQAGMDVVVEFGGPGGVTEMNACLEAAKGDIESLLQKLEPWQLLAPEGRSYFKERIVTALNLRLRTARVRQVYLPDFRLIKPTHVR